MCECGAQVRIAEVYAVAFAASWASALLVVPRCERALGKRGACVACLCLYGAGALLCGRGASYEAALLGRALAGAAQSQGPASQLYVRCFGAG